MFINHAEIGYPDQESADALMNSLLVDIPEFERISCLDWRVNAVYTPDSSGYDPMAGQNNEMFNPCVRRGLISGLISSQRVLENIVGFDLTDRDYSQTFRWHRPDVSYGRNCEIIFKTDHAGISALNKQRLMEYVTTGDMKFYLQENISIDNETEYCSANISRALFPDPRRVLIRQSDTGRNFPVDHNIAPVISGMGNEQWKIGLADNQMQPPCSVSAEFSAQHYDYVYADCLTEDSENLNKMFPVYPGTNQLITYQKRENIEGGVRFWFYNWDVTDSQFSNTHIDLAGAYPEFWKLISEVDFVTVTDEASTISVSYYDLCTKETVTVTDLIDLTMKDAAKGIFTAKLASGKRWPDADYIDILIHYQTSPSSLGRVGDLNNAKEAIAYFAAAELKQATCGCTFDTGFIKAAQESYSKVRTNIVTGDVSVDLKYGSLYGHLVFHERVQRIKRNHPLFVI
jgi:hypothetical protein